MRKICIGIGKELTNFIEILLFSFLVLEIRDILLSKTSFAKEFEIYFTPSSPMQQKPYKIFLRRLQEFLDSKLYTKKVFFLKNWFLLFTLKDHVIFKYKGYILFLVEWKRKMSSRTFCNFNSTPWRHTN